MPKLSLKNKLSLSIILTIVLFGSLANFIVFSRTKNIFLKTAKERLEIINLEKAHGLSDILWQGDNLANILSSQEEIKNYLGDNPKFQNAKILDLLNGHNIGGAYSNIYIMAPDGTALVCAGSDCAGRNYGRRDFFIEAFNGREYLEASIGIFNREISYYFSSPIKSSGGEIIGVAAVEMNPKNINDKIHLSGTKGEKRIMFANSDGIIIYSTDSSRIYKSLGALPEKKLNLIEEKKMFPGVKIESLKYDLVLEQLPNIENSFTIEFFDWSDKEEELVIATKVPGFNFFIISESDSEEFTKESATMSYILGCFVALAATFALLIIMVIVNKFLKPLSVLDKGVHQIGKGNLDYRINIKTGDELERLAGHVNGMAKKLKLLQEETKKKLTISTRINKILVERELAMKELKKENEELRKKRNQ